MTKEQAALELVLLNDQVREEMNAGRAPRQSKVRAFNEATWVWDHVFSSRRNAPRQRSGADR